MKIIESPAIRLTQLISLLVLVTTSISFTTPSFTTGGRKMFACQYKPKGTVHTYMSPFQHKKNSLTQLDMKGNGFFDDSFDATSGGSDNGKDGDSFNMEELNARISSLKKKSVAAAGTSGLDKARVKSKRSTTRTTSQVKKPKKKPDDVHIILFNPDTEQEGVHTIEFPKGSGNNVILAFEDEEACGSFSDLLKDQLFLDPIPQKMKLEFLEEYCETLGVTIQLIPNGMNIRPPKENVESLVHKDNVATLDYIYSLPASPSYHEEAQDVSDSKIVGEISAEKGSVDTNAILKEENNVLMVDDELIDDVRFVLSDNDSWGVWE